MASRRRNICLALLCVAVLLLSPELFCLLFGRGRGDSGHGRLPPSETSSIDLGESGNVQVLDTVPPSPCSPVRHVAFLKVHKAGSTTLANILQRFALGNDLNLVLPNKSQSDPLRHCLGNGRHFDATMVIPLPPGGGYDILSSHVVYNREVFRELLPSDTTYVAILREPEERFISAAFYYGLVARIERNSPDFRKTKFVFTEYLKRVKEFQGNNKFYNAMAFDFGVPEEHYHDDVFLDEYLQQLDREFRLVLLMEYFDESLVLLRRHLCWSLSDILYMKLNSGARGGNREILLSEDDRQRLRTRQNADFRIYEYFVPKFWAQIHEQGPEFYEEVFFFKSVLRSVSTFCAQVRNTEKTPEPSLKVLKSLWSDSFEISPKDCNLMRTSEPKLVDFLIQRQWNRFKGK